MKEVVAKDLKQEGHVVVWAGVVQNMTFSPDANDFYEDEDGDLTAGLADFPAGEWELRKATLIVALPPSPAPMEGRNDE